MNKEYELKTKIIITIIVLLAANKNNFTVNSPYKCKYFGCSFPRYQDKLYMFS